MIYADYEYYATVYRGTAMDEEQFCGLARKASAYVDYITMSRARSAAGDKLEAVQNCVCALAELEQDAGKLDSLVYTTDRPVSSETVGGWSRSFGSRNLSQADIQRTETRRREIVLAYLGPTGLLESKGVWAVSMFPHTVTIYNVSQETDPATFKDVEKTYITVLRGVLLEASKAANVRQSGLEGADAVNLYIPFSTVAVDGVTGAEKRYVGPQEFWRATDKSGIWTLSTDGNGGTTFFIKGEVVEPDKTEQALEMLYDDVYKVTKVDMKDFGSQDMRHFEVGGA